MLGASDEETIKVIIVGDGFTGKTSLLRRFVRGDFTDQYKKTIGAEFLEKDVYLRNSDTTVKLMLWDTAGQEVFNALTQAYYRGAGAAVLAFSTVDRESFVNVTRWKERVEAVCGPIVMVLCQTKFDLSHEAAITNEESEGLAKLHKVPFYRVSSKDDFNVTQLFEFTAQQCLSPPDDFGEQTGENSDPDAADAATPAKSSPAVPIQESSSTPPAAAAAAAARAPASQEPAGASGILSGSVHTPPKNTATAAAAAAPSAGGTPSAAASSPTAGHGAGMKKENERKVNLQAPQDTATADGKKKKKKRHCTLL